MKKEYLARVQGNFGSEEKVVKKWVYMRDYRIMLQDCEEEDKLDSEMRKTAKDAETLFRMERYDPESDTSLVRCFPRTGRTH